MTFLAARWAPTEYAMIRAIRRLWNRARPENDRRRACRYPTDDSPVYLGWWEGDAFRTTTALLKDVSMRGAAVLTKEAPGVGLVWLCHVHSSPATWAEGTAVAVQREPATKLLLLRRRWTQVRMEFSGACSFELFKSGTGTGHWSDKSTSPEDVAWGSRR